MKVQILQLDPHDDLASARDRLAWAQAQRVLLVWPDRARLLRRQLDLVLLRRQAASQGIELGIVTHDPIVLEHAAELRIPAFRSSTRLREEVWQAGRGASTGLANPPAPRAVPRPPVRSPARPLPKWLRATVLAVLSLTLIACAITLLPSATITLHPKTVAQQETIVFTLDTQAEGSDANARIPARQVVLRPSGAMRVTTTGVLRVPGSAASGEVTFTNLTDEPVLIPAGTGVLPAGRPDLRFATVSDLTLPAGQGAMASMRVVAVHPGVQGNRPAGSVNAIDGPLGIEVSVAQPQPMVGGAQTERAAVAPADQAAALKLLTERLLSEATDEVQTQLGVGEAVSNASLRVTNTPEREFDRKIGEAADSVGLKLTLEVTALVYRKQDVDAGAALVLVSHLPAGTQIVPATLTWGLASTAPAAPDLLAISAVQQTYLPLSAASLTREARGRRPAEAAARLASMPGQSEPPRIDITPRWWPIVPWLEVRIRVRSAWASP